MRVSWPGAWPDSSAPMPESDFDELPGDGWYEIVDGELQARPPAGYGHQSVVSELCGLLWSAAPAGWRHIRSQTLVRLPTGDIWAPDVSVMRPGTGPVRDKINIADLALAVEIVSERTTENDHIIKPRGYAEHGVDAFWRVERAPSGCPIFVVHTNPDPELRSYQDIHLVRPGERYEVTAPFSFTIDAAAMRVAS